MTAAVSPTISPAHIGASSPALWTGRVLSAVVVLAPLADAAISFFAPNKLAYPMAATGFSGALSPRLGILMLVCAVLYAIPRTSVLGAILVTAFLGGAICVHFRIGEIGSGSQIVCLPIGIAAWLGLYPVDSGVEGFAAAQSVLGAHSQGAACLARVD